MLEIRQFDRNAPDEVLNAMFAARKAIFVDLLKWDVPVIVGTYEVDQFDDDCAAYIILCDTSLRHLGSARLLPTTGPHILESLYTGLCEDSPPTGPGIVEITRFCLDRRLRARERQIVRDALVRALVDHAHRSAIASYTAVAEGAWLDQILAFGWNCRSLGSPKINDGSKLGALEIRIERDTHDRLNDAGIIARPSLAPA